jgi:hypothetical protein
VRALPEHRRHASFSEADRQFLQILFADQICGSVPPYASTKDLENMTVRLPIAGSPIVRLARLESRRDERRDAVPVTGLDERRGIQRRDLSPGNGR